MLMPKPLDLTGSRFGKLTVLSRALDGVLPSGRGYVRWKALCDCGELTEVATTHLRSGGTVSCGCWRVSRVTVANLKHGGHGSPEYITWRSMIQRCENPKATGYSRYGGVGVKIHPLWRESFSEFLQAVGPRPTLEHSLDRYPDPHGDYVPGNVRWATAKQQRANHRKKS